MMASPFEFLGYLAAILMGLSLGAIGGGGSILTVPILVYLFRQDPLVATTTSLFVVGITALVGGVMAARKGLVDIKIGLLFAIPSFIGVVFARHFLLPMIPDVVSFFGFFEFTKALAVMLTFSILMIFSSIGMIKKGKHVPPEPVSAGENLKVKSGFMKTAAKGFFVGTVTGFIGAGGGFLIVPALVLLLKLPMRTAIGTSLAIIAANSLFGFSISYSRYPIEWASLLTVSTLGVTGLLIGRALFGRTDENKLKNIFGYFVLVVGLGVLLDQIFSTARV